MHANRAACELVGKPPEEVVGRLPERAVRPRHGGALGRAEPRDPQDRPPDRRRGRLGWPHAPDAQDPGVRRRGQGRRGDRHLDRHHRPQARRGRAAPPRAPALRSAADRRRRQLALGLRGRRADLVDRALPPVPHRAGAGADGRGRAAARPRGRSRAFPGGGAGRADRREAARARRADHPRRRRDPGAALPRRRRHRPGRLDEPDRRHLRRRHRPPSRRGPPGRGAAVRAHRLVRLGRRPRRDHLVARDVQDLRRGPRQLRPRPGGCSPSGSSRRTSTRSSSR